MNNNKDIINIANILTFSRIIFGFIFLFIFSYIKFGNPDYLFSLILNIFSFIIFVIAIITDGLDGYFARKNNKITEFGKHFDPLADSIFFIIIFFTFVIIKLMPLIFFIILFVREFIMHFYLRPYVKKKGSSLPANIYGKIKTIFQSIFSLLILSGLIIKDFLILLKIKSSIIQKYYEILIFISIIFFTIIVFLSLLSFFIYIFNVKKKYNASSPKKT